MRYCDILGLHVNAMTAQAKATILQLMPGVLKVLNTAVDVPTIASWRAARPDGLLIFRSVQDDLSGTVQQRCDTLFAQMALIDKYVDVVECPWNENYQSATELAAYAGLTNQAITIIESRHPGIGVGMFSVDNPDPAAFYTNFASKLVACNCRKYLCVHEYDAPTMTSHGYCGRFTQLTPNVLWPVLVTECGIDGGVLGSQTARKGWRSYATTTQYGAQLQQYARLLYARGAKGVAYCCGQFGDWFDFEIAGEQDIINALNQEVPMPTVGAGFTKALTLIGPWTEDQTYDDPGTPQEVGKVATPLGHANWVKATNETLVYVNDGRVYRDWGNHSKDGGLLHLVSGPFLA